MTRPPNALRSLKSCVPSTPPNTSILRKPRHFYSAWTESRTNKRYWEISTFYSIVYIIFLLYQRTRFSADALKPNRPKRCAPWCRPEDLSSASKCRRGTRNALTNRLIRNFPGCTDRRELVEFFSRSIGENSDAYRQRRTKPFPIRPDDIRRHWAIPQILGRKT